MFQIRTRFDYKQQEGFCLGPKATEYTVWVCVLEKDRLICILAVASHKGVTLEHHEWAPDLVYSLVQMRIRAVGFNERVMDRARHRVYIGKAEMIV